MGKKLQRLSYTLGSILKARGMQARLSEYCVTGHWEQAVGQVIARHARPLILRGSKLFVAVDSPAWMQQLSLMKPEIIEKVNRSLGKDAVKEIMLNIGEIPAPPSLPVEQERPVDLSREERGKIEACVQEIRDADVRAAVRRVMEKDFLGRKAKQKK